MLLCRILERRLKFCKAWRIFRNVNALEPENFHDVWVRYAARIYRFALYLSGDPATAEDLTAESFLRLWARWERIQWPTVHSYLCAIARNLYFQQRRRGKREGPLAGGLPGLRSLAHEVEVHEELEQALAAMRELPEIDRSALLLRAQGDLTYEEIASVLGLPVSTARVKVHRARLRLAEICGRRDSLCQFRKP